MYYYRRKTNPLKWIIIILIIIGLGALIYWFYANYFSQIDLDQPADQALQPEITEQADKLLVSLSFIQGDVLMSIDGQAYEQAFKDKVLHQADKIKTGADSLAVLNLENGSIIRLGQNTELILSNLMIDNIIIKQTKGRSYYNLQKTNNFQVESLSAIAKNLKGKFELITNTEAEFVAALNFIGRPIIEIYDEQGLLLARRLADQQKALIDFNKEINDKLTIEKFEPDDLIGEDWYQWNFALDENIGQPIADQQIEQADDEPDFSVIDQSLELAAELKQSGVFLSWSIYDGDDFKNYKIVRSKTNSNLKYPDNQEIKSSLSQGLNSYLDQSIETGEKYYYRVCVIKTNNKVVCGNVVNSEIPKDEDEEKDEEDIIDNEAPAAPNLSASISIDGVSLTWNKNTENDFKQYIVLRSVGKINPSYPTDQFSTTNNTQLVDNNVNITSVGNYYYQVCSLDQSDNYACSNIISIENGQIK
jgi:hypothetical protein